MWLWFLVVALALTVVVLYLTSTFPEAMEDRDSKSRLVYYVALLAVVGSSLVVRWRARPGQALRYAAIWIAIGAALVLLYSFRDEGGALRDRMVGELLPHKPVVAGDAVSFQKSAGGHFIVEAEVEGVAIRFLVDTGASDITLTPADARRLGFDVEALVFNRPYQTANGIVMGAPVTLRELRVGPIVMRNVRASVNGSPMDRSLLGMSFLGRLASFEFRGDRLLLRP